MVWGGVSLMGSTRLAFVDGSMDAAAYQKILRTVLTPTAKTFRGPWFFQQDNARPHVAKTTMAWFAGQRTVPAPIQWPPYSPDLSPIENMWSVVEEDVNKTNPKTLTSLKRNLTRCWNRRIGDGAFMRSLMDNWRERIVKVRDAEGATLKY